MIANLLKDHTVLVTGGASGIGQAIVQEFLTQGARVAIFDVQKPALADQENLVSYIVDVREREQIEKAVTQVETQWGLIDILINSVGVMAAHPLEQYPPSDWQRVLDTDLSGPINCAQVIGARLVEKGQKGSIINITSTHSIIVYPGSGAYDVAKAGLLQYTRLAATEWGKYGIRVNAIAPGHIPGTGMNPLEESTRAEVIDSIPLGRPGKPQEVAQAALFLASDLSSYITGTQLVVDGGHSIHAPFTQPETK